MKLLLLALATTALVGLVILFAEYQTERPDNPQLVPHPNGNMLAVKFAHKDHTKQDCVACHHNYVDNTGSGMCFDCHKTDPEVAPLIEEQFHNLCRGCHQDNQHQENEYGPIRSCFACHQVDNQP